MRSAEENQRKAFLLIDFFIVISGELILVFHSFTHFPARLQHLWMWLPLCGHSDVNLSWELCTWHGPVPALIPLFQTRWDFGRPPLFGKTWLNLANRWRTALGGDAQKKKKTNSHTSSWRNFSLYNLHWFLVCGTSWQHPKSPSCQWILYLFPAHYTCLAGGCFLSFPLLPAGTCTLGRVNCWNSNSIRKSRLYEIAWKKLCPCPAQLPFLVDAPLNLVELCPAPELL